MLNQVVLQLFYENPEGTDREVPPEYPREIPVALKSHDELTAGAIYKTIRREFDDNAIVIPKCVVVTYKIVLPDLPKKFRIH